MLLLLLLKTCTYIAIIKKSWKNRCCLLLSAFAIDLCFVRALHRIRGGKMYMLVASLVQSHNSWIAFPLNFPTQSSETWSWYFIRCAAVVSCTVMQKQMWKKSERNGDCSESWNEYLITYIWPTVFNLKVILIQCFIFKMIMGIIAYN